MYLFGKIRMIQSMGVSSYSLTQYTIQCDCCGIEDVCVDSNAENVHSKQQAIHRLIDGTILCNKCFLIKNRENDILF